MMWGLAYAACLGALFVRLRTPEAVSAAPQRPAVDEPVAIVRWHHRVFYVLLLASPLEALMVGSRSGGRAAGLGLFVVGVALYRLAARSLGDALSPFVLPRPGAALVTTGPYRWIRHPMYLGQACIALGAPLTVGARWSLTITAVALLVLGVRVALEEAALERTYPEYPQYTRRVRRFLPFVF